MRLATKKPRSSRGMSRRGTKPTNKRFTDSLVKCSGLLVIRPRRYQFRSRDDIGHWSRFSPGGISWKHPVKPVTPSDPPPVSLQSFDTFCKAWSLRVRPLVHGRYAEANVDERP